MTQERHESDDSEQEKISLRDNDKEDTDSKTVDVNEKTSFVKELRHNEVTRFNFLLSICVTFAFSMLGWRTGQAGPALLDIIHISGTDLEKGSAFTTSFFAGNILGTVFGGAFYSKINKYLMLVVSLLLNSLTLAIIPWCVQYEAMIAVHTIHGICNGIFSVVLSAVAVSIWGATARGRVFLNIFYASYSAAGLLSPLVTSPFLLPTKTTVDLTSHGSHFNSSDNKAVTSDLTTDNLVGSVNNSTLNPVLYPYINHTGTMSSNIFIAYSISAGLNLLSSIPFIVIYFKSSNKDSNGSVISESHFIGELPLSIKVFQLVNIGIFSTFYMSSNFTFGGYLVAFCVQHLRWTKTSGALLTSVLFLSMFGGRIFGAYLSRFLQPIKMLFLSTVLHAVGLAGLSVCGAVFIDTGIWIFVCVIGIALSLMWPSLVSWTNENLIAVRGKVTSYFCVTGFLGALLSPLLFGYMMEERSPIWFCFLSLGKAAGTIINVILMFVFTKKSQRRKRSQ